jgi:lipoate-protein ligase A
MTLLDLTFPTPAENLACDEVLLEEAEKAEGGEMLRFWEPENYFVVVGYGNNAHTEVHAEFCRRNNIPILRRCTGGGAVLQGPGILNYSLILRTDPTGPSQSINAANRFIMERHRDIIASLVNAPVQVQGHTDLAIGGLKFSGNSQRRKKRFLLFHGSFLLHFDIGLIERSLPMPTKQPDYRQRRSHSEFLRNLNLSPEQLRKALSEAWNALDPSRGVPLERISSLAREKYSSDEWSLRQAHPDPATGPERGLQS